MYTRGRYLKLFPPLAHRAQSKQVFQYRPRIPKQRNMLPHKKLTIAHPLEAFRQTCDTYTEHLN